MSWLNWDRYPFVIADIETGRFIDGFDSLEEAEKGANRYSIRTKHKVVVIDNTADICSGAIR